jgi:hypothetical protein
MSVATKMKELVEQISNNLKDNDSCQLSTCDCASYGWDSEKHHAMHALARHGVPGKQWRFQHVVKFEVTDWTIIDEGKLAEALAAMQQ